MNPDVGDRNSKQRGGAVVDESTLNAIRCALRTEAPEAVLTVLAWVRTQPEAARGTPQQLLAQVGIPLSVYHGWLQDAVKFEQRARRAAGEREHKAHIAAITSELVLPLLDILMTQAWQGVPLAEAAAAKGLSLTDVRGLLARSSALARRELSAQIAEVESLFDTDERRAIVEELVSSARRTGRSLVCEVRQFGIAPIAFEKWWAEVALPPREAGRQRQDVHSRHEICSRIAEAVKRGLESHGVPPTLFDAALLASNTTPHLVAGAFASRTIYAAAGASSGNAPKIGYSEVLRLFLRLKQQIRAALLNEGCKPHDYTRWLREQAFVASIWEQHLDRAERKGSRRKAVPVRVAVPPQEERITPRLKAFPSSPHSLETSEKVFGRLIATRDTACLAELYRRHSGYAHRFATSLLGDPHTAHDLVHEAFIRIANAPEGYEGGLFPAYLRTVVYRMCQNASRKKTAQQWPRMEEEQSFDVAARENRSRPPLLEREAQATLYGILWRLEAAIDRLPPEQREPGCHFYLLGRSLKETARSLDRPLGTVKRQLFDLRRSLRRTKAFRENRNLGTIQDFLELLPIPPTLQSYLDDGEPR